MAWLYLPNGCKWEFTRELLTEADAEWAANHDYAAALLYTNRLLALGASVTAPGLEAGEQKEQVGYVVYRSKVNDDATETPIIDLYLNHEATKFKFLTVYLNTPEDVTAFEQVSGLKLLSDVPYWEGGHLERGNPKTDKYFVAPRKALTVVHKLNERYNPDEPDMTKRKPKRLFVRWDTVVIPTLPPAPPAPIPSEHPPGGINPYSSAPAIITPKTTEIALNSPPGATVDTFIAQHWDALILGVRNHSFNGVKPSGQEIANTINKMKSEGAFTDVTTYPAALALIIQRIGKHYEKKTA